MPEFDVVISLIGEAGATGVLILVIVGLLKGWIVTGKRFEAMKADRDFWRNQNVSTEHS